MSDGFPAEDRLQYLEMEVDQLKALLQQTQLELFRLTQKMNKLEKRQQGEKSEGSDQNPWESSGWV